MIKKVFASTVAMSLIIVGSASAALIQIDLSPPPGLALNSANYLMGDHTLGLSAPNAVGQPASPATGNEIGSGITFDTVTKVLSWDMGYGSDHGFVDLLDNWTNAHIHGPNAVLFPSPNTGAGVRVGLPHTPGSTTLTGSFTGSAVLIAADEVSLLDNLLYVNIHSAFSTGGEIRGQLVPVPAQPEPAPALPRWAWLLLAALLLLAVGLVAARLRTQGALPPR